MQKILTRTELLNGVHSILLQSVFATYTVSSVIEICVYIYTFVIIKVTDTDAKIETINR